MCLSVGNSGRSLPHANKRIRLHLSEIWANWTAGPSVCLIRSPTGAGAGAAAPHPTIRTRKSQWSRDASIHTGLGWRWRRSAERRRGRKSRGRERKTGGKGRWKKGTKNKGVRKMEGEQRRKRKKREGLERRKTERKTDWLWSRPDAPPLVC